ncbi:MAG: metal-sensitive transcriptional regulator [Gemmatimonadota bacterium]
MPETTTRPTLQPGAEERTAQILRRLKSVEGHIRGIERMVEEGAYCVDIVHQIHAVQQALKKVSAAVLDRHLHTCVIHAIRGDDDAEKERVLEELLDLFEARSLSR